MDTTFISIHDLTPEARILYSSDSVVDILGYTPDELVNRSCWDFFPRDELPYAQKFHQKRVSMDKAAVLAYCNVRTKQGDFVGCECCFTVVYDVMIVCTSIYQRDGRSEGRALSAPLVRRIFSSSPRDPRYHMLSHLSAKFKRPVEPAIHEPRAALFLNRFTRTLTIMYATSAMQEVLGVPAEAMRGRSFYYCIAENCLQDAVKCLENAKGNDSIAYLRFWFRDPRLDDPQPDSADDSDEEMTGTDMSEDTEGGGVQISSSSSTNSNGMDVDGIAPSRSGYGAVADNANPETRSESTHRSEAPSNHDSSTAGANENGPNADPIEIEAVISCASDGLVVCLRRARPMIPHPTHRPSQPVYANGLFAAPWAVQPILPPLDARGNNGFGPAFAPSLGPMGARAHPQARHDSASPPSHDAGYGPEARDFMAAIRDQAVFAWALTGINGSLYDHSIGKPTSSAIPHNGLPIWESDAKSGAHQAEHRSSSEGSGNGNSNSGWSSGGSHDSYNVKAGRDWDGKNGKHIFGDPGLGRSGSMGVRNYGFNNDGTPR